MERVLVAGGAGYIGSHTNKLFANSGYKTVVFDNLSNGHRRLARWGEFFKGDLANPADLARCFRKYKIHAVMHFAAFTAVGESVADPAKYYRNNVVCTLNLLDAMRAAGVKYLIFSSTAATYGEPVKLPIIESHPQNPVNPYGRTKLIMERAMADYAAAYGLKYAALRYFNAAGADPDGETGELHEPETHLIPLVLQAASGKRKSIKVFGGNYPTPDGTCLRDYIHVCDLAQAHLLALKYLERGGQNTGFNLGNGKGFSVLDVIKTAEQVTGKKIPVEMAPRRAGDPAVLVAGSARIKKVLGWKPQYPALKTIVEHAWNWQKENQ